MAVIAKKVKNHWSSSISTNNHLNNHISHMITKLSAACYAVRSKTVSAPLRLSNQFVSHIFHSVIRYRIIFGGNLSNSAMTFTLQKKTVRIMAGELPRTPCRSLLKN
jgi:hypothetical protein